MKLLLVIFVTIVMLEITLTATDPFGMAFFPRVQAAQRFLGIGNGSYTLSPGTYDFGDWSVTMTQSGTRHVPAATGDCKVLFVGDSVAWGLGVDDEAAFANILARDLGIQAINAAVFGYNTENVLATLAFRSDFDLGVYLISPNDEDDAWQIDRQLQPVGEHDIRGFGLLGDGSPATLWYALYLVYQSRWLDQSLRADRFLADLEQIAAYDNLLIFGFDDPLTGAANRRYDVHIINWYTQQVSVVDSHPNAVGHREIADAMRPVIETELPHTCPGRFSVSAAEDTLF